LIALLFSAAFAGGVSAAPISGNGFLGDFTGDFTYNAGSHTVSVTLTNASTTAPGGRLVAFAFNLPGTTTDITGVTYGNGGTALTLLGGTPNNSVSVQPYGHADIGAGLGGSWLGGGSPNPGLAVNQTATWTFQLQGDNTFLNNQTTASLFNALTTGGGAGQENFLVRFRGFDNGGSDKVPGGFGDPPIDPVGTQEVPEPTSLIAFAVVGSLGLFGIRKRRNR
jgi:hypothetical protein